MEQPNETAEHIRGTVNVFRAVSRQMVYGRFSFAENAVNALVTPAHKCQKTVYSHNYALTMTTLFYSNETEHLT